ncbi:MAG: hypothetical protein RSD40_04785 [Bacilli bacterium]
MAVCYFNQDYSKRFDCEYVIKKNIFNVFIEYDINKEIEPINECIFTGGNTNFENRDILIVDSENKKNYLLKDSYYVGHTNRFGTPDELFRTTFQSRFFFISNDYEKLCNLLQTPKVNEIKIFSKDIITLFGTPSLSTIDNADEYILNFKRDKHKSSININSNYIKKIAIGDSWKSVRDSKNHMINIDLCGYIELELTKKINYDAVYDFVYELVLFMQLYHPDKFIIEKIQVTVDKNSYELCLPIYEIELNESYMRASIHGTILDHLAKCYNSIPYRNSKTEIRNIPYIILNTSRGLEDNFLMFYRFIECYYKKQSIPNIRKSFISYSIKTNYKKKNISDDEVEQYSQEIICLRNHYVHAGYYIKNESLRISFDRINRKKNPKENTANNVDVDWIYNKTKILYEIAVDIIFSNMLNYDTYNFDRHF